MEFFPTRKEIIIWDTEYTAWEGSMARQWSGPNEHREIVQIGAIRIDTEKLTEIASFSLLVRPKLNPILSSYFSNLTGITQKALEASGVDYPEALGRYQEWCQSEDMYSFGGDEKVLRENCELRNISFSFENQFFDVRRVFIKYGIPADQYNSGNIVEAFGKNIERPAHDALNDARSILSGLRLLTKEEKAI